MKQYILFIIFALLTGACSSKIDLDQAKQLKIQPVIDADILYFDLHKVNLTDNNGHFRQQLSDTVDFGIFEDGKVRDGFVKAEITVVYRNTFFRQFDTDFYFIDAQDNQVEADNFVIEAANTSQPEVIGETTFIFDKTNNPDFVNFRKIVVRINLTPDNLPVEDKSLHLQAKGKFYTQITIE